MAPREKNNWVRGLACTVIAPGAGRTPAALAGARAAGSLNRHAAQGSLRTLRAGRLRRADLQPNLGLAKYVAKDAWCEWRVRRYETLSPEKPCCPFLYGKKGYLAPCV